MKIREDFKNERVKKAQDEFEMAETKFNHALSLHSEFRPSSKAGRFVFFQDTVTYCTKAIFRLLDVQFENDHAIGPNSASGRNLLQAISEEVDAIDFPRVANGQFSQEEMRELHTRAVARLLFLCEMFGNIREFAYYGFYSPEFEFPADDLIGDTMRSVATRASFTALWISDAVMDSIATGQLPSLVESSDAVGPMAKRSEINLSFYGSYEEPSAEDPVSSYRRGIYSR